MCNGFAAGYAMCTPEDSTASSEGAIYLFAKLPEGEHVQWFSGWLHDRPPAAATVQPFLRPRPGCALHCVLSGCWADRCAGCEDDNAVVQWLVMKHKVCTGRCWGNRRPVCAVSPGCMLPVCWHTATGLQPPVHAPPVNMSAACLLPTAPGQQAHCSQPPVPPFPACAPTFFSLPRSASSPAPPAASPAMCGPRLPTSSERGRLAQPLIAGRLSTDRG